MIKSRVIAWSGEVLLLWYPDLPWLGKQRLLIPSELSVCPGSWDEQAEPPAALQERGAQNITRAQGEGSECSSCSRMSRAHPAPPEPWCQTVGWAEKQLLIAKQTLGERVPEKTPGNEGSRENTGNEDPKANTWE